MRAFGSLRDTPAIRDLVRSRSKLPSRFKGRNRTIRWVEAYYVADFDKIFSVRGPEFTVSAMNTPTMRNPTPRGLEVKNTVTVFLDFTEPQSLRSAVDLILHMNRFFEFMLHEKLTLTSFSIIDQPRSRQWTSTDVYITTAGENGKPERNFRDCLISGSLNQLEFEHVATSWLSAGTELRNARRRCLEGIRGETAIRPIG